MVTIIVLVYNNLIKLEQTIRSILQQDYLVMEVIVSDDCSKDFDVKKVRETIESYKEYKSSHVNLLVRKNEFNQGIVKHYNHVIKISTGDIIIPLSCGDVFYQENTVTIINDFFSKNHCLIATAKRQCAHKILPSKEQIRLIEKGGKVLANSLCHGNFISGSCIYYSRNFFEKFGYFDERLFLVDDYPTLLRILFAGENVAFIDTITVYYEGTGVSSHDHPNPLFQKDMDQIFDLVIKPNQNRIGVATFRYLKCRHYVNMHTRWLGILYSLLYPDVLFIKLYNILISKTRKE